MALKVSQRLFKLLHFDDIKYKSPHSKALEAFLTGGTNAIPF
jgi:hypothetical protein